MTTDDLVPRILAAIEQAEQNARTDIDHFDDVPQPEDPRDRYIVKLAHGSLRRCEADRCRLERHAPAQPDGRFCRHDSLIWPCPDFLDLADSYGLETLNPEPGSQMAEDLAEGVAQVEAGEAVPAEVIVADLAARLAASASVHQEEDWFIAQAANPDVASQGRTEEEARANLREAVELHLTSATCAGSRCRTRSGSTPTSPATSSVTRPKRCETPPPSRPPCSVSDTA